MFKPGTEVTWTSQAGGYEKTKTGTILYCILKNDNLRKLLPEDFPFKKIQGQMVSQIDRYLVEVKTGPKAIKYYTPYASWIRETVNG